MCAGTSRNKPNMMRDHFQEFLLLVTFSPHQNVSFESFNAADLHVKRGEKGWKKDGMDRFPNRGGVEFVYAQQYPSPPLPPSFLPLPENIKKDS